MLHCRRPLGHSRGCGMNNRLYQFRLWLRREGPEMAANVVVIMVVALLIAWAL